MKHVLQFKITLRGVKPPIWRRVQVPEDYSFWDLHVAILSALDGWDDHHLHLFTIPDRITGEPFRIGIPDEDGFDDDDTLTGWEFPIKHFFGLNLKKAVYTYDFGDDWEHDLVLEAIMPAEKGVAYPRCTGGRRQCPPEDCGGVRGYLEFVEIMQRRHGREYREMRTWHGEDFDPEEFRPSQVVFDDPDRRWEYAFAENQGGWTLDDLTLPTRMRRIMVARKRKGRSSNGES
jgi:hypothetical protein